MQIEIPEGYESLGRVLALAVDQAAKGKGLERHAKGEPFDEQKICRISRAVGVAFALGQAEKKIEESQRVARSAGLAELLGAINYTAAAYIVLSEGMAVEQETETRANNDSPLRVGPARIIVKEMSTPVAADGVLPRQSCRPQEEPAGPRS